MKLKNKTAIITGGAKGIGKSIALKFAQSGADLIIADLNFDLAKTTVEVLKTENKIKAIPVKVDVTDSRSVEEMVKMSINYFGGIDILVNNAGIVAKGWVKDFPEEVWDKVIDTNLKSTFLCSKAVLPYMIEQQYGRIINISSIAGKQGEAAGSAYCSSKFGVIGFTQSLALEVAKYNIFVNAVCPGPILTDLGKHGLKKEAELRGMGVEELREDIINNIPAGKFGSTEDVANMCLFLVSDYCSFSVGAAFNVNGGQVLH